MPIPFYYHTPQRAELSLANPENFTDNEVVFIEPTYGDKGVELTFMAGGRQNEIRNFTFAFYDRTTQTLSIESSDEDEPESKIFIPDNNELKIKLFKLPPQKV